MMPSTVARTRRRGGYNVHATLVGGKRVRFVSLALVVAYTIADRSSFLAVRCEFFVPDLSHLCPIL